MNPAQLFSHEADALVLQPGQALFSVGDPASEMYVLLEGEADIIVDGVVVEHSTPGALLGEMGIIDDSPRTATVVAKTTCKFSRISQKRFQFLVQQTPFFSIHVMKVLVARLREMNLRMVK